MLMFLFGLVSFIHDRGQLISACLERWRADPLLISLHATRYTLHATSYKRWTVPATSVHVTSGN